MTKPIVIYGKQEVIIHVTDKGEMLVSEIESHDLKDLAKYFAKILNRTVKELKIRIKNNIGGTVYYNEGLRCLDFNIGYMQK